MAFQLIKLIYKYSYKNIHFPSKYSKYLYLIFLKNKIYFKIYCNGKCMCVKIYGWFNGSEWDDIVVNWISQILIIFKQK